MVRKKLTLECLWVRRLKCYCLSLGNAISDQITWKFRTDNCSFGYPWINSGLAARIRCCHSGQCSSLWTSQQPPLPCPLHLPVSMGAPAAGPPLAELRPSGAMCVWTGEEPEQEGRQPPTWVWGEREAVPGSAEEDTTWHADQGQWEHEKHYCVRATAITRVQ